MKVDFYGVYRQLAGRKTLELEISPGGRLRDVLRAVTEHVPAMGAELFDERGNLFGYIPLYLNGRNPRLLAEGLDRVVQPADVLSIFSPIASGRMNVEEIKHSLIR
jgi:molybdopterin converting factor small subunit